MQHITLCRHNTKNIPPSAGGIFSCNVVQLGVLLCHPTSFAPRRLTVDSFEVAGLVGTTPRYSGTKSQGVIRTANLQFQTNSVVLGRTGQDASTVGIEPTNPRCENRDTTQAEESDDRYFRYSCIVCILGNIPHGKYININNENIYYRLG